MTTPDDDGDGHLRWLTAAQAAEYCQVSRSTFRQMVRSIPIPYSRPAGPNGQQRFFRENIDAALLSRSENLPANGARPGES